MRFTRIKEMFTSLIPHSLQYKLVSVIVWTTSLTFNSGCFQRISLLRVCISTISRLLSSWRVGLMKWWKRLFEPRKTLNYNLPLNVHLSIKVPFIYSSDTTIPYYSDFLNDSCSFGIWLVAPYNIFVSFDVTTTCSDLAFCYRKFSSRTLMLLFLSSRYVIMRVYFFFITIFYFIPDLCCFF